MMEKTSFSELMHSLGIGEKPCGEKPAAALPPRAPADSLRLSVQAEKALPPRTGSTPGKERDKTHELNDNQGNQARISGTGKSLSVGIKTAWETDLKNTRFPNWDNSLPVPVAGGKN